MEYAESCLNLELKKHRTGLPTTDVMRITWQLVSALQYLHSRKVGASPDRLSSAARQRKELLLPGRTELCEVNKFVNQRLHA